jgi:hypothetical protein
VSAGRAAATLGGGFRLPNRGPTLFLGVGNALAGRGAKVAAATYTAGCGLSADAASGCAAPAGYSFEGGDGLVETITFST